MTKKKDELNVKVDWFKLVMVIIGLLVGVILTIRLVGSF
jgi:hypothetical protein